MSNDTSGSLKLIHFRKSITTFLLTAFIGSSFNMPNAFGATGMVVPVMPKPGTMVSLSPAFIPAHLQGIVIHPDNALQFDFLIQPGDEVLDETGKHQEFTKLIKYFLAALTVPDKDQWVNLSPYENDRIIKDDFGRTEMGRDLLGQDYLLKQITSSLMYPESGIGKNFWDKVYQQAYEKYGKTNIPMNTFNKVWIVPDEAVVYESSNIAYIERSHLKVMLEEDYLSLKKHTSVTTRAAQGQGNDTHSVASKVIKDIILPALEREVNQGRNFAQLRQVFSGMILATWYKKALKESLLGKVYVDKAKVRGVDQDPENNELIYQQYLEAFKKGVFNYIKDDINTNTHQSIPRKYFAGGISNAPSVVKYGNFPENFPNKTKINPAMLVVTVDLNLGEVVDDRIKRLLDGLNSHSFGEDLSYMSELPDKQSAHTTDEFLKSFLQAKIGNKFYNKRDGIVSIYLGSGNFDYPIGTHEAIASLLLNPGYDISKMSARDLLDQFEIWRNDWNPRHILLELAFHLNTRLARDLLMKLAIAFDRKTTELSHFFLGDRDFDLFHMLKENESVNNNEFGNITSLKGKRLDPISAMLILGRNLDEDISRMHTAQELYQWIASAGKGIDSHLKFKASAAMAVNAAFEQRYALISELRVLHAALKLRLEGNITKRHRLFLREVNALIKNKEKITEQRLNAFFDFYRDLNYLRLSRFQRWRIESKVHSVLSELIKAKLREESKVYLERNPGIAFSLINRFNHPWTPFKEAVLRDDVPPELPPFVLRINDLKENGQVIDIIEFQDLIGHFDNYYEVFDDMTEQEKEKFLNNILDVTPKVFMEEIKENVEKKKILKPPYGFFTLALFHLWVIRSSAIASPDVDKASVSPGGIDMSADNMAMVIKRDGRGMPLPIGQQDLAQLSKIEGFFPRIIEIKPASSLSIFNKK